MQITLPRAARFHRLLTHLASSPRTRMDILAHLNIGLRTFYRELDLLRRCGIKVRHKAKLYHLVTPPEEAQGRLPFPDPQLSFAEMAELAQCDCPSGRRLAQLLAGVIQPTEPPARKSRRSSRRTASTRSGKKGKA